jgi:lysophospholipase L1-like esterase
MRRGIVIALAATVVTAAAAALVVGGGGSAVATTTSTAASTATTTAAKPAAATPPPLHLVALGDSLSRANSCDGCTGWVELYGQAIQKAAGRPVVVDNRGSFQFSNVPAGQLDGALRHLLTDPSLRKAIAGADIVVIGFGLNDTPWGRLDDPCNAAPDFPVVKWKKITRDCIRAVSMYEKQTLDQILTEVDQLRGCGAAPGAPPCSQRGHADTLIRVVTTFNAVIGDTVDPGWNTPIAIRRSTIANRQFVHDDCEVAVFHGGLCANVYRAFNGPTGLGDPTRVFGPDGSHFNQQAHNQIAGLLVKLGYKPLLP